MATAKGIKYKEPKGYFNADMMKVAKEYDKKKKATTTKKKK